VTETSQLLTMTRAQLLDAMGAAHAPMKAAGQIARCHDEEALRVFVASHPARRVQAWAEEMAFVADWLAQSAAAVRAAPGRLAQVLERPAIHSRRV